MNERMQLLLGLPVMPVIADYDRWFGANYSQRYPCSAINVLFWVTRHKTAVPKGIITPLGTIS